MPNQELSLVPADSSSQQFTTTGQVDWAGLGRMQFSASIAVLGRLSAAGVEPLTVAVGQAMCSRIPLGVHGEKVLMEAMGKLKAFSSYGDLIWFGVGVRHILRTLVQTSQGASLVALCAALAEGHSTPFAALIMFEMSKLMGGPEDLRPSYDQWQALVKVCSSVLAVTTFGVRLQQLLNLCGFVNPKRPDGSSTPGCHCGALPDPPEFAEAVLGIGKVSSGTLQDVELTGGRYCAWLAVFAEYVLGLRVQVRQDSGQLLTMNHCTDERSQVTVIIRDIDTEPSALRCTGQSYTVSSGTEFVRRFFNVADPSSAQEYVRGGRVLWQSMLHDVFGDVVDDLLKPVSERQWVSKLLPSSRDADCLRQDAFLSMLVYAAECIVRSSSAIRYADTTSFLQHMPLTLPELTPIRDRLLKKGFEHQQLLEAIEVGQSSGGVREVYNAARHDLGRYCDCKSHAKHHYKFSSRTRYCIVEIAQLIIVLICMLEHLDLDCPILPKQQGISELLRLPFVRRCGPGLCSTLASRWVTGDWAGATNDRLRAYKCLFSSELARSDRGNIGDMCAFGDGAIYCYMDTIVNMTDKVEQAYRVHVGAGTIKGRSQAHRYILDGPFRMSDHPVERFEFDDSDANLFSDTTSLSLRMEPVVNEGINISFSYKLFTEKFYAHVPPSQLARLLFSASQHRVLMRSNGNRQTRSQLIESKQLRVNGEGFCPRIGLDNDTFNVILRPHHGNLLGRIVSLLLSERFDRSDRRVVTFLVDNKEDLARAKLWINDQISWLICCFIS